MTSTDAIPTAAEASLTETPPSEDTAPKHSGVSRRKVILGAAGGVVAVIVGGTLWRAEDQGVFSTGQGPAYEPWEEWNSGSPQSMNLVRAAILAANPHNSQPWLFHVGSTRIDLYADLTRKIGLADPFLSELHIGLGCAIENMLLAAPVNGFAANLTLLPDASDATHVVRIDLRPGSSSTSALYRAIPDRHTNRYPYDTTRAVAGTTLDALAALNSDSMVQVRWMRSAAEQKTLGDLIVAAAHAFVADKPMNIDDNRWYRATWQELQAHRDGITLDAAGLPDLTRALGKLLPPESLDQQNSYFLSGMADQVKTASALGLLAVPNKRDDAQRMQAGRLWQRMHLWAMTQGLAMQPLNYVTELVDRETVLSSTPRFGDALRDLVADSDWQAIMTFRIGYPTHAALRSPRRGLTAVVKA